MDLFHDLRYALRVLSRRSGFTAVAVLTLALGIGANTAIFSVVHSVLLRPLPFPEPERLVEVWESRVKLGWNQAGMNPANFWDFQTYNQTFEELAALLSRSLSLTGLGFPERVDGAAVSAGFFRALGTRPLLGRTFAAGEDEPGADHQVALLANGFWRRRFGADPGVVGSSLTFDGRSFSVVGVLPPGGPWLDAADVFVPLVRDPQEDRTGFYLQVVGRLKPGVTMAAARADLEAVARRLEEQFPEANAGIGVALAPASVWVAGDELRRALWVLLGAVSLLLLIACVNLANMLLAKATDRTRETAVRAALGADRGTLVRQSLVESLVLGALGAAVGLVLAGGMIQLVKTFDPGGIPRLGEVRLDAWVLAFTASAALFTGALSGLLSALQGPRTELAAWLREGDRSLSGRRAQKRSLNVLVAAEVALSLMLLVGAGLLIRSFAGLLRVDRGFATENRLALAVDMPSSYEYERRSEVRDRFLERVAALPAVASASAVNLRPLSPGSTGLGIVAAGQAHAAGDEVPWASWRLISPGYFETLGIPLLRGRAFDERDVVGDPWRVVISERLAERLWPGEDPVGRTAVLWKGQGDNEAEVVGVVGNMRERGLEADPTLAVYLPYRGASSLPVHFVIHASADPSELVPTLRAILAEIDPGLPLSDVRSLDGVVGDSVATRRFHTILLAIFAAVALGLALAGIYGVQAYSVTRRTSEIGVRVAMGARPRQVLGLIVGQGMRPAVLGIVLGVAGALALSRVMTGLLFGVAASDPLTYVAAALVLAVAAGVSSYLPALRALHLDPVTALRGE